MRNDLGFQALFSKEEIEAISHVCNYEGKLTFSEMALKLGLRKERDLRFADLKGVDLSFSDIRGYDFTGADLRGVVGIKVDWNESTCFEGADIEGSMFASAIRTSRLFSSNPRLEKEYFLLKNDYWSNQSISIHKIARSSRPIAEKRALFERLFVNVDNLTLKTDILMAYRAMEPDVVNFREFLLTACYSNTNGSTLKTVLRTLADYYRSDEFVLRLLFDHIKHDEPAVRLIAVDGVVSSKIFSLVAHETMELIKTESDGLVRRKFVERYAARHGARYSHAVAWTNGYAVDFKEVVRSKELIRAEEFSRKFSGLSEGWMKTSERLDILSALRTKGIPFEFDDDAQARLARLRV